MEINETNKIKYSYGTNFTCNGKNIVPEEREQPNSYEDKSANDAVTNTGKALISFKGKDDSHPKSDDEEKEYPKLDDFDFYRMCDENGKKLCEDMSEAREVARLYKDNPAVVTELINIKDKDEGYRLKGYEIGWLAYFYDSKHKETINRLLDIQSDGKYKLDGRDVSHLADIYDAHEESVNELLDLKTDDGEDRLKGYLIKFLYNEYEKNPDVVKTLLDKKRDGEYLFRGDEGLKNLTDAYQNNPEILEELMNKRDKTGQYLFDGSGICNVADVYNRSPEVIDELLNIGDDRLNGECISKIAKTYVSNREFMSDILSEKDENGSPKYNSYELSKIANAYEKQPEFIPELLKMKNNDGTQRFSPRFIDWMLSLNESNPTFTQNTLSMKKEDGEYRFSEQDYIAISNAYKINPKATKELIEMKDEEGKYVLDRVPFKDLISAYEKEPEFVSSLLKMKDNNDKTRFFDEDMLKVTKVYSTQKEFVSELVNMKDKNNCYKFNAYDIVTIVKAHEEFPELIESIYKREGRFGDSLGGTSINEIIKVYRENPEYVDKIINLKNEDGTYRFDILDAAFFIETTKDCQDFADKLIDMVDKDGNPRFTGTEIYVIISASKNNRDFVEKMLDAADVDGSPSYDAYGIWGASRAYEKNPELTMEIISYKDKDGNPRFKGSIEQLSEAKSNYPDVFNKLLKLENPDGTYTCGIDSLTIIPNNYSKDPKFFDELFEKDDFSNKTKCEIAKLYDDDKAEQIKNLFENYKKLEIEPEDIPRLLNPYSEVSIKELRAFRKLVGKDNYKQLNDNDIVIGAQIPALKGVSDLNEISRKDKKNLLKTIVKTNTSLFDLSPKMRELFPLLPANKEEYCTILPLVVRSLGIETKELSEQQTDKFNKDLSALSDSLKDLSDDEFSNLEITQDYTKDEFINDVVSRIKSLPKGERNKVFDYFGFELHKNEKTNTGYDISGYPVNLNNGQKLERIDNPETKALIEDLRSNVIRFSENNRVKCDNPVVEEMLNNVIDVLPELRPQIGKVQHGSHDYDVFKHSLKVMQKVSQDINFKNLSDSDKKVILLASLLHDVTKREGLSDPTHAEQSSFDAVFISKKFNLSKKEELKLYTLIRNHEWLGMVNTSKSQKQLNKRLQSVAYDLQHDNIFDMSLMFTHADLRAVRKDDSFHDKTEGDSRIDFEGNVRSFGESADLYAVKIKENIAELKKSQPILPTTKLPKASKIDEKITTVNHDGSTNIKGVYKNKDGLVIIKYNEVEDWEELGLSKGSVSKGIHVPKGTKGDAELKEDVDTGNIKFIVHGLDYENQLAKFDAFSLLDSDALLSVSYTERPESKYRFFRAQGVILDVDTEYIHGGGNTDIGSGCGKSIEVFKKEYIFGGPRKSDRVYISNLIKNTTGMSDEEYVEFVEKNKNKSMDEIEPKEYRDIMIRAFATINSNTRKGNRSYNEMYISNPNGVNAVFAYNMDSNGTVDNPVKFLDEQSVQKRTKFLQEYAQKNDVPFVVFGD